MYKTILIGGINRSGGSLLQRLFDGHPKVASYPLEFSFSRDESFYPIFESYTGIPLSVPELTGSETKEALYKLLHLPLERPAIITEWGKERSDPLGVRKNYIEKAFYDNYQTNFDHAQFFKEIEENRQGVDKFSRLFDIRHKAYFRAWDNGKYSRDAEYVCMHDSSGIYITNMDVYFREFPGAVFIYPIRDVFGYIASEKTRLARRYFGSRRFAWPKFPNKLVKIFDQYDLEAQVRAWLVSVTRGALLQEKYGQTNKFVIYRNENLVQRTEETMRSLCDVIGLEFSDILLRPTIAGKPWGGNSHQGRQEGISAALATYYPQVLRQSELDLISRMTANVTQYLNEISQTPINLSSLPHEHLQDYRYQKKYFEDKDKIALYSALVNAPRRRVMIKAPTWIALLAYLYSIYVRIIHMPRMLKLKWFPGVGKQNYT